VDNKASAAFLIREWNGGVACERRESFISRVNASDALISAFDDTPFFSICAGSSRESRASATPAGVAATLVGVLSDVFRFVIYFCVHRGFVARRCDSFMFSRRAGIVYSRNFRLQSSGIINPCPNYERHSNVSRASAPFAISTIERVSARRVPCIKYLSSLGNDFAFRYF